ncbi:MAG: hypothetical protein L3J57_12635, partial [Desulfuromusa sp.]|nr:hypothetical protein [Desulfuromusa sp.]
LSEELRGQCKLSPIIKRPLNMKILRTVPNNHGMLVKTMWQSTRETQNAKLWEQVGQLLLQ